MNALEAQSLVEQSIDYSYKIIMSSIESNASIGKSKRTFYSENYPVLRNKNKRKIIVDKLREEGFKVSWNFILRDMKVS